MLQIFLKVVADTFLVLQILEVKVYILCYMFAKYFYHFNISFSIYIESVICQIFRGYKFASYKFMQN